MTTREQQLDTMSDGRVVANNPAAEPAARRMRLWGANLYTTWAPSVLFLIDVLLIVIVAAGVGVARNNKAKPWETDRIAKGKPYEPWNLAVYRIGQNGYLSEGFDDFASHEKWAGGMSNVTISANIDDLVTKELHLVHEVTEFKTCLMNEAYVFAKSLKGAAQSKHSNNIKDFAWHCAEYAELPLNMWHFATLNILHLLLIWCVTSLAARAFSNYGMTPVKGNEAKHNVAVVSAVVASLAVLAVFVYSIYEAVDAEKEFASVGTILLAVGFLGMMYMGYIAMVGKSTKTIMGISRMVPKGTDTDEDTDAFNVGWILLCLIKPMIITPLYVVVVFGLCGMTEFLTLFNVTFLAFVLSLMCGTSSYYNLYATHRKLVTDDATATRGKTHRETNVIFISFLLLFVISFTPWPRRMDVDVFWGAEFGIFFLVFGLGAMVLPDVIFHRRFTQALSVRERAETFFRVVVSLIVLAFVF